MDVAPWCYKWIRWTRWVWEGSLGGPCQLSKYMINISDQDVTKEDAAKSVNRGLRLIQGRAFSVHHRDCNEPALSYCIAMTCNFLLGFESFKGLEVW